MWTAYLFQTTNGNVGPKLNYESLSWGIELNGSETISVKLKKSELPKVDLSLWLAASWAGIVLCYSGTPVVAGLIANRPDETLDTISINCTGIRSLLVDRIVVTEQRDWADLSKSVIEYKGKSLGTIAKNAVKVSMAKPGGALPISFPLPDQTVADDADHQRTYRGFNLQNITCDDILTKLSNVTDGPDIMFKPRFVSDNQLTLDMWHGTEFQPRIYQEYIQVWDTTPEQGQVTDMSIIYTGNYQASRVYSTGAGSDEGLLIKVNTNDRPLQKQFPLREKIINAGNSENPAVVDAQGKSNLAANEDALLEVQMTVRGDGPIPFGKFWPGDLAHVYTKGWVSLPDGLNPMRILSMSGDNTNNVKVSLQLESKFNQ